MMWCFVLSSKRMYTLEIALLIVVVILLISNYVYQPAKGFKVAPVQSVDQVNCQDCSPSTKVRCKSCSVNCLTCSTCAPNCNLCKTDCQKCKTGSCQPSCDACVASSCIPDCKKCSQACVDCSMLDKCPLPYKGCKIVGQSLSFNIMDYAIYNEILPLESAYIQVITNAKQGHIISFINAVNVMSIFVINNYIKLLANLDGEEVNIVSWNQQIEHLTPVYVHLRIYSSEIEIVVDGGQFSKQISKRIVPLGYTIYIGGLPDDQRARTYFTQDPYVGFTGCLTDIVFGTKRRNPRDFVLRGANVGCPRRFIKSLN